MHGRVELDFEESGIEFPVRINFGLNVFVGNCLWLGKFCQALFRWHA